MTIVAIVISPPQMALQVMLTTAKVVMALNHQNYRVLLMTVKVKIRMAQRDRTQQRMKAQIQTLPKAIP
jgi:hypothetical protein